jgi:hypothetical protein
MMLDTEVSIAIHEYIRKGFIPTHCEIAIRQLDPGISTRSRLPTC